MGESTSLFKVFRVLWFPVSINAMALGAAAVVLFWAGSWICALVAGMPEGIVHLGASRPLDRGIAAWEATPARRPFAMMSERTTDTTRWKGMRTQPNWRSPSPLRRRPWL